MIFVNISFQLIPETVKKISQIISPECIQFSILFITNTVLTIPCSNSTNGIQKKKKNVYRIYRKYRWAKRVDAPYFICFKWATCSCNSFSRLDVLEQSQ